MNPAPSAPDLADARRKTLAYLQACGLPRDAALRWATSAENTPSLSALIQSLDQWADSLPTPAGPAAPVPPPLRHRAALLLARVPARWPEFFLAASPPPELRHAVDRVTLAPTPGLSQTTMTPQPLNLGALSEVADETWRTFDKWPFLRGLTIWTLFLLLLGVVFYTVRF